MLSALFVLSKIPAYQEQMMQDAKDIHLEYKEQKKTQKQKENWISVELDQSITDFIAKSEKFSRNRRLQMCTKKMARKSSIVIVYIINRHFYLK